ncbi:tannase-domain-containing protein [Viridothelium virens]|uniref:Carboxylic ester hydrolase n=1 Tax=Viridothelium virens TaxID=1048519 RepID=A0A6A6HES5_VIRVR|nr:tannase-domain-containing protein [Viridothelium virens]
MVVMVKQVTESVYREKRKYSYWNGCSTGGRQGLMLAQRYPNDFDGIFAMSPAINWDFFMSTDYYPQLIMNELDYFPTSCELAAIAVAAMSVRDSLDGFIDSIISLPNPCHSEPHAIVETPYSATTPTAPSPTPPPPSPSPPRPAPTAAPATPNDPDSTTTPHSPLASASPSPTRTAPLPSPPPPPVPPTAPATPHLPNPNLTLLLPAWPSPQHHPRPLSSQTSPTTPFCNSRARATPPQSQSGRQTPTSRSLALQAAKLLCWRGLASTLVLPNGTADSHARAREHFRLFEAPGRGHCVPRGGPYLRDVLGRLVEWVEGGETPEVVESVGMAAGGGERGEDGVCVHGLECRGM